MGQTTRIYISLFWSLFFFLFPYTCILFYKLCDLYIWTAYQSKTKQRQRSTFLMLSRTQDQVSKWLRWQMKINLDSLCLLMLKYHSKPYKAHPDDCCLPLYDYVEVNTAGNKLWETLPRAYHTTNCLKWTINKIYLWRDSERNNKDCYIPEKIVMEKQLFLTTKVSDVRKLECPHICWPFTKKWLESLES